MTSFRNIYLCFFLLLSLFSCSKGNMTSEIESDRLYIRAVSRPFSEDSGVNTKAVNNGFLTSFEAGDAIGVTGIDKNGNILSICDNVRFEYQRDSIENGLIWSSFVNERGYNFVERVDGATYFAYYPYDEKWNGRKLDYILENFTLLENQSSKENFDMSDLMTCD